MKLNLTIEYSSGETATFVAAPPEWAKWEKATGYTIQQVEEKLGIHDMLFLAYHSMKRQNAGQPIKPFEAWCETVEDISAGRADNPKAIKSEA